MISGGGGFTVIPPSLKNLKFTDLKSSLFPRLQPLKAANVALSYCIIMSLKNLGQFHPYPKSVTWLSPSCFEHDPTAAT